MDKKRASSSVSRSKAPVGRGEGHDVVMRLLNVLEALVPNHGGLLVSKTNSQAQTQVQLNVAATQAPQLTPQSVDHSVTTTRNSKDLKNFMDIKPLEFDCNVLETQRLDPRLKVEKIEKSTPGHKTSHSVTRGRRPRLVK
ncbi:hypothetical protein HAX54_044972 [Datura stramonium]|uniref:Uncharacterized protein n=1 Tax=Datura stramonium TaxID=4076 RepID=A0ABS8WHP3_DATST|nr:hypothetical protein [Datura stramonium]